MKTINLLLFLAFVSFGLVQAQTPASRTPDGGGGFTGPLDEISPEQRQFIQTEIEKNRQRLVAEGVLPAAPSGLIVSFDWPLRAAATLTDPGYHGISNFVDLDANFPNFLLDYNCGARTYDLSSGYNHSGIDFFTWPFGWYKMDFDQVEIVAAAAGIIVLKQDGNPDRNCDFGGRSWNAVYVQHSDNSVSWYGHMKNGSTTAKNMGQSVAQGEYLGIVGSSGNSTGPHLHFETYDASMNLIEPYSGTCNNLNAQSWWAAQRPYRDSAINALMTHDNPAVFPECPAQEILNLKNIFLPGDVGVFAAYFRDDVTTLTTTYRIRQPDNSVWQTWTNNTPQDYDASWWWWSYTFPANATPGTWTFEADYNGQSYTHSFTMDMVVPVSLAAFDFRLEERRARLTWTTVSEDNNLGFEVQHKFSENFLALGFVRGNGTTVVPQYYKFLTEKLAPGRHQFRLKQIDLDGSFTFSDELEVNVTIPGTFELSELFPNPFNPATSFTLAVAQEQRVQIAVIDARGRSVRTLFEGLITANQMHRFQFNGAGLSSGIYFVRLKGPNFTATRKGILLK